MEEEKPIINEINTDIKQEENFENKVSSTKIIIENDISEFERPEDPKLPPQFQAQEKTEIEPENILVPQTQPPQENEQNNNIIIDNNTPNINNNNNVSNTNLTLITNTDPGYIASQSNNEISSIPPSKSKTLGKKLRREYICEVETCKRILLTSRK